MFGENVRKTEQCKKKQKHHTEEHMENYICVYV